MKRFFEKTQRHDWNYWAEAAAARKTPFSTEPVCCPWGRHGDVLSLGILFANSQVTVSFRQGVSDDAHSRTWARQ